MTIRRTVIVTVADAHPHRSRHRPHTVSMTVPAPTRGVCVATIGLSMKKRLDWSVTPLRCRVVAEDAATVRTPSPRPSGHDPLRPSAGRGGTMWVSVGDCPYRLNGPSGKLHCGPTQFPPPVAN